MIWSLNDTFLYIIGYNGIFIEWNTLTDTKRELTIEYYIFKKLLIYK
jgi:hypothetical protein